MGEPIKTVESLDKPTRDAIKKALVYLEQNRAFWNAPQVRCAFVLRKLIGESNASASEPSRSEAPKGIA